MKKIAINFLSAAISLLATTNGFAQEQERRLSIKLGGGISVPIGEYAKGKSRGSTFLAGVSVRIFKSIHLAGNFYDNLLPVERGQHDKNRLDDEVLQILGPNVDAKVWLEGANFGVMYRTSTSPISVYGLSSIGYTRVIDRYYSTVYSKKFTAFNTETAFSVLLGGGVQVPITATIGVALDVRYIRAFTDRKVQWMPVAVSVVFNLWKVEPR